MATGDGDDDNDDGGDDDHDEDTVVEAAADASVAMDTEYFLKGQHRAPTPSAGKHATMNADEAKSYTSWNPVDRTYPQLPMVRILRILSKAMHCIAQRKDPWASLTRTFPPEAEP